MHAYMNGWMNNWMDGWMEHIALNHINFFSANMHELINCARERGKWDFYSRSRQLLLIGCLEDATNEVPGFQFSDIMLQLNLKMLHTEWYITTPYLVM